MKKALTQTNEQRLSGTRNPNYIKSHNSHKGINHLTTLQDIADRWAGLGYYKTPDRALKALIRGVL